ncbi:MAG: ATP-binding protein [bacterium]
MLRRVSLANKCLLLFGLAVVLIIIAALAVPWVRLNKLVDDAELQSARQMVATWEASARLSTDPARASTTRPSSLTPGEKLSVDESLLVVIDKALLAELRDADAPIRNAWEALTADNTRRDYSQSTWGITIRSYTFALPIREGGQLRAAIVLHRQSTQAARTMLISTGFLLSAGLVALGLAVLVFYLITNKLILSPVRQLRETAEQVRSGKLDTRSQIQTGDEFEDLAEAFNDMLQNVQDSQQQLRTLNATLDDKLTELQQRNASLADAARLKGEFLASVTHELRTPLNSIIGFAELLDEQAQRDPPTPEDSARLIKRRRYIENINSAGRALLELINGLLEMARVEAGKVQLNIAPISLREACETMLAMMKPAADKRSVELRPELAGIDELGPIHTDARKLQQILYNLMSNAIKFTADAADAREARMAQMDPEAAEKLSRQAHVTLRAEHLPPRGAEGPEAADRVRISVLDTGPGIAPEDQQRIFEKFTQLDGGLGRKHAGTGLGLSIVKELTSLLQGEILVQSTLGQGSIFSLILPITPDHARTNENKLEQSLRGALLGSKA